MLGEKKLEADVAVTGIGMFASLSQANNVGKGIDLWIDVFHQF